MNFDKGSIMRRKQREILIKRIIDIILVILIYQIILVFVSCLNKIDEIDFLGIKAYRITTRKYGTKY